MKWFRRPPAARPARRRFAELAAMTDEQRRVALAAPDAGGWIETAAIYGLVEAQILLGQLHLDRGNPAEALPWFRIAADAGHTRAINMVGRCYENGWGVPQDAAAAARHFRRAAEQGLDWAQFNLANLMLYGLGVDADRRGARRLYVKAARQGHAKSMNMLGRFHEEGWDGPRNIGRAHIWYRRAAEAGDFRAQYNLGTILAVLGERAAALAWFERAIACGSPDFLVQAGAALRASMDPDFSALGDRISPALPPDPARQRC